MASANQSATLIVLGCLLDQFNRRSHLTLLFSGVPGIGKTEAVFRASEKMNGNFANDNYASIDGSTTFEGDISGNPHLIQSGKAIINAENFAKEYLEAWEELLEILEEEDKLLEQERNQ